jgi:hypothetical protein
MSAPGVQGLIDALRSMVLNHNMDLNSTVACGCENCRIAHHALVMYGASNGGAPHLPTIGLSEAAMEDIYKIWRPWIYEAPHGSHLETMIFENPVKDISESQFPNLWRWVRERESRRAGGI